MNTEKINIGKDCETLIVKYLHQLILSEKYDKVIEELNARVMHHIADNNVSCLWWKVSRKAIIYYIEDGELKYQHY